MVKNLRNKDRETERERERGRGKKSEKENEDGNFPAYFFEEKERRGGQTSDSDVCEVPIAIARVVNSQQNEI